MSHVLSVYQCREACATFTGLDPEFEYKYELHVSFVCVFFVNAKVLNCVHWSVTIIFAERPPGYDRVRNAEIGNKDFELDVLEEAYTTEHWLVRIYKVGLSSLGSFFCLFVFFLQRHLSMALSWHIEIKLDLNVTFFS